MTDQDLDAAYTQLCRTLTSVGQAQAPLVLARFALLAMTRINDRAEIERMIADAAEGIAPAEDTRSPA